MSRKTGTDVPKTGTIVPHRHNGDIRYAEMIASALHSELGRTHRATKTIMNWTGASERTVKHWLAGTRGPSGDHLVALSRHSDVVTVAFLSLCDREPGFAKEALAEVHAQLVAMLRTVEGLL